MCDYLDQLINEYENNRKRLTTSELDILCLFNEDIRTIESAIWKDNLGANACEFKGLQLTAKTSTTQQALAIKQKLIEDEFHNVRVHPDLNEPNLLVVLAKKQRWLNTNSRKAEHLYKTITQHTQIMPIYTAWFAGTITVDISTNADIDKVRSFLRKHVMKDHHYLIEGKDPLLSLDVVQLKIVDRLANRITA